MTQQAHIELALSSDHKMVNGQRDQEIVLAVEIAPSRSMISTARQRSAHPHIGYGLDVSGSMQCVTDDPSELVEVGSHVIDGHMYRTVQRADGEEMGTLMTDMFEAAESSLQLIKDQDQISILHFSSEVSSVESCSGAQRARATELIRRGAEMRHDGTNMSGAIDRMRSVLERERQRPKSCVLFTDGMPDEGTEAQVLASARRCAEASIPINVCAFGDDLSLDFLGDISAITGGLVTIGRNQEELLRQFSEMVRDAQAIGLVELSLKLTFDDHFLPEEVFRGKPQSQFMMRLSPRQREVTIPLGNLNAGSWQSIYVKGRLLSSGETRGEQPIASCTLTYRVPAEKRTRQESASYTVPRGQVSRVDRQIQELVEITLLKSLERDFHICVKQQNWRKAQSILVELLRGYEAVGSPDGDLNAERIRELMRSLSRGGKIDPAEIQRLANLASESSTTSAQSERFGDGSSTNVARSASDSRTHFSSRGHTQSSTQSETGWRPEGEQPRAQPKRRRREVIQFDI